MVWSLARKYWDGSVLATDVAVRRLDANQYELRFDTRRGFHYQVQSAAALGLPFADDGSKVSRPFDAVSIARTNDSADSTRFHRVVSVSAP